MMLLEKFDIFNFICVTSDAPLQRRRFRRSRRPRRFICAELDAPFMLPELRVIAPFTFDFQCRVAAQFASIVFGLNAP